MLLTEKLSTSNVIYHISYNPIYKLSDRPMWFKDDIRQMLFADDSENCYIYKIELLTNKGCNVSDIQEEITKKYGERYGDLAISLCENPDEEMSRDFAKVIKSVADVDYVIHDDYDLTDYQNNNDSIFVLNPLKSCKILMRLDADFVRKVNDTKKATVKRYF